jgi:hypothetical protein
MTLVSSASNIDSDTEFILRGGHSYTSRTTEALEMILGELHVSRYPSQRKKIELD